MLWVYAEVCKVVVLFCRFSAGAIEEHDDGPKHEQRVSLPADILAAVPSQGCYPCTTIEK